MPPMELAFDQGVVHDPPAVVDRDVAQELGRTGVGIDLDLGDMRTARKRGRRY